MFPVYEVVITKIDNLQFSTSHLTKNFRPNFCYYSKSLIFPRANLNTISCTTKGIRAMTRIDIAT